jgi:hypothetical protein
VQVIGYRLVPGQRLITEGAALHDDFRIAELGYI